MRKGHADALRPGSERSRVDARAFAPRVPALPQIGKAVAFVIADVFRAEIDFAETEPPGVSLGVIQQSAAVFMAPVFPRHIQRADPGSEIHAADEIIRAFQL